MGKLALDNGAVSKAPTKAAISLAVKAAAIAASTGFEDLGAIAVSIESGLAHRAAGTKLSAGAAYHQAANYEPEYFTAPKGEDGGKEVVIHAKWIDAEDGSECSLDLLTTWQQIYDGLKKTTVQTWFDAESVRLIEHDGTKGLSDDNKEKRRLAQQRIGRYMALQGQALEKVMYPERSKKGPTEKRRPLTRIKDDNAAILKFVQALDPEQPHYPEFLDVTKLATCYKEAETLIAAAFVAQADANKSAKDDS